jgi:hypothetical protein
MYRYEQLYVSRQGAVKDNAPQRTERERRVRSWPVLCGVRGRARTELM